MGTADAALIDLILEQQLDLLRFEAGVRSRVLAILNRLQGELTSKLSQSGLTEFNKERTRALLRQTTAVIDKYYATAQANVETAMVATGETVSSHTAKQMGLQIQLGMGLPTQTFLARIASNALILGASSAEWWTRQAQDTAWRFANALRQGLAAAETNEQIVRRIAGSSRLGISGVMEISRQNARALVHTSIQAAANEARMETFRKNSDVIVSVRWLATLDSHTCLVCASRDQKTYSLKDDPPEPLKHKLKWDGGPGVIHWGCRCVSVPVTKSLRDLGVDVDEVESGKRASSSGPVSANTRFEEFLKRKGKAFEDEVLGPGRADLWRKKKLTLEQLLSLDGTRLTLAQLRARYA